MHSSFQNTGYNHTLQTQILGPSGLKIFAGEDLSKYALTQQAATAEECNRSSRTFGGGSNRSRKIEEIK
jgi:hypothetical protein